MRILLLANVMPYPPHGGFQLRVLNLLRRISAHHEVVLGCHIWDEADREGAAWLSTQGIRTITAPLVALNWRHAWSTISGVLLRGQPPEIAQFQSRELRRKLSAHRFDIVQIEESTLAPYRDMFPATKSIITFHNIHHVQEQRIAAIATSPTERVWRRLNARAMRRYEPRIAARFDRRIVVSDEDRRALDAAGNRLPVDVLPNGVDTAVLRPLPPPEVRHSLLFVGTLTYRPCSDGAIWLAERVMPALRERYPDIELWIVGRRPPREVLALARDGVFVTGTVDDVVPYYARAAIACVPLRAGGGSRLKILEAMALGRPVVSTAVGAEGLTMTPGEHLLIADDADAFAAAVAALLDDEGRARAIAENARQHVQQRYDWDGIAGRQLEIYDELARS